MWKIHIRDAMKTWWRSRRCYGLPGLAVIEKPAGSVQTPPQLLGWCLRFSTDAFFMRCFAIRHDASMHMRGRIVTERTGTDEKRIRVGRALANAATTATTVPRTMATTIKQVAKETPSTRILPSAKSRYSRTELLLGHDRVNIFGFIMPRIARHYITLVLHSG